MNDPNKIGKVIIPLVLIFVVGEALVSGNGVPGIFQVLFIVAFAIAVPSAVFYLIAESGWRALAKFKATKAFEGEWVKCATGQMALVSVDDPDFQKVKMRFIGGSLQVASTPEALHLSTMFSKLPIVGLFFPALRIPWTAVSRAHEFEAPGWFAPPQKAGTVLQVAYDPNYTGRFVEMEIGVPPVFIQLPLTILGDAAANVAGLSGQQGPM